MHFPVRNYFRDDTAEESDCHSTFARRCNGTLLARIPPLLVCTQCGNYYLRSNFSTTQTRNYYKSANVLRCTGCKDRRTRWGIQRAGYEYGQNDGANSDSSNNESLRFPLGGKSSRLDYVSEIRVKYRFPFF